MISGKIMLFKKICCLVPNNDTLIQIYLIHCIRSPENTLKLSNFSIESIYQFRECAE